MLKIPITAPKFIVSSGFLLLYHTVTASVCIILLTKFFYILRGTFFTTAPPSGV